MNEESETMVNTGLLRKISGLSWNSNLKGHTEIINPYTDLKDQIENIPYNTKREIVRDAFTIGKEIGSGNFGKVNKGLLSWPHEGDSKTTIAIKSIGEHGSE